MAKNNYFPLVSVIIPVYNREKYIEEAIKSVIKQDYNNFEIIVVDGHSTDKTMDIVRLFKDVKYYTQPGSGLSEAFNYGLKKATGKFIAFQSADDVWLSGKIKKQMEILLSENDIEYTITGFRYFLDEGTVLPEGFKKKLVNTNLHSPVFETFLCRKSLMDKIGGFDINYKSAMDVEWFARLNDNSVKMRLVPETLLLKRIHSKNTSLNDPGNNLEIIKALRESIKRKKK